MSMDDVRKNLGSVLSIFAKAVEAATVVPSVDSTESYNDFVDELISYFPMNKVNSQAGTYDQYLYDLRKTVVDNYNSGNYQVSYFHAHLIFMSYIYYSIDLAYALLPGKVKDQYDLINAYNGKDKPSLSGNNDIYSLSNIPEKEIFKVFYAIGMDVQYIQELASYVKKRDDYAHATGKGNIDDKTLKTHIDTIKRNMDTVHKFFQPYIKGKYIDFLITSCKLTYKEAIIKITDFIMDENFSTKDIEYLSNMGISNIRNENNEFKRNYRFVRKIHCALAEYCIDMYGIEVPSTFKNLRNDTYLKFKYADNAKDYVEQELGIDEYSCVKDGGEFPVYDCPKCSHDQLVFDAEADKYHCFHCSEDFAEDALMHCTCCNTITYKNKVELCPNCIEHKMAD